MAKIIVKQTEPEIPAEVIASSIVQIAQGMRALDATRLKRDAIVELIHAQSKIPKGTIKVVLNNLVDLERDWLNPRIVK